MIAMPASCRCEQMWADVGAPRACRRPISPLQIGSCLSKPCEDHRATLCAPRRVGAAARRAKSPLSRSQPALISKRFEAFPRLAPPYQRGCRSGGESQICPPDRVSYFESFGSASLARPQQQRAHRVPELLQTRHRRERGLEERSGQPASRQQKWSRRVEHIVLGK